MTIKISTVYTILSSSSILPSRSKASLKLISLNLVVILIEIFEDEQIPQKCTG